MESADLDTTEGEAPELELSAAADVDTVDESETEQSAAEALEEMPIASGVPTGTEGWSAEAQLAAEPLEAQTGVSHSTETVTPEVDEMTEEGRSRRGFRRALRPLCGSRADACRTAYPGG